MYSCSARNNFFRACCAVCAVAITPIGTGFCASPQIASNHPSFEVATVKPVMKDASHPFNPRHIGAHVTPTGASYWYMTVRRLVEYAYGVEQLQVTGPEWTNSDRFDIEARFPEGADKRDDRRMLQVLLKDRFEVAFHIEKRELEVYALVVGKHGEKLRPSLPDPGAPEIKAALKPGDTSVLEGDAKANLTKNSDGSSTLDMGKRGSQTVKFDRVNWANHFELSKETMEELAKRLGACLGSDVQKVVDETGIKGNYQVAYDCPAPRPQLPAATDGAGTLPTDPEGGSLLTRSLDALGLKLEKRKMLMDVYVLDHVQRPSQN